MLNAEADLEQLEQFLDQGLGADDGNALQARLAADPELAAALSELKAQRAVRAVVWQSLESDEAAADRLMWRVRSAIAQGDWADQADRRSTVRTENPGHPPPAQRHVP